MVNYIAWKLWNVSRIAVFSIFISCCHKIFLILAENRDCTNQHIHTFYTGAIGEAINNIVTYNKCHKSGTRLADKLQIPTNHERSWPTKVMAWVDWGPIHHLEMKGERRHLTLETTQPHINWIPKMSVGKRDSEEERWMAKNYSHYSMCATAAVCCVWFLGRWLKDTCPISCMQWVKG